MTNGNQASKMGTAFPVVTPICRRGAFPRAKNWKRQPLVEGCRSSHYNNIDRFQGGNVFGNAWKRVSRFLSPIGGETETETVWRER